MIDAALGQFQCHHQLGNLLLPSSSFDCCKLFFRHPVASREVALYLGQPYQRDKNLRVGELTCCYFRIYLYP